MMRYLFLLIITLVFSCAPVPDPGNSANEPINNSNSGREVIGEKITMWTDKTEFYVEFPALVVGKISSFAAHFTKLNKHQPVEKGSLTVSLIKDNSGIRNKVDEPDSPGIFNPALRPKEKGIYQLVFDLNTPEFNDKIIVENVRVYESISDANQANVNPSEDDGISFLKEQAWKTDFQTKKVRKKEIYDIINTSGTWKSSPSDYKTLVAKTSGTVDFKTTNLTEGARINKGQELMTVTSKELTKDNLKAEIEKAKANFDFAKSEYDRKKSLLDSKIVSQSVFEETKNKYLVAKSDYETLKDGHIEGGKHVIVPFNGYIKSININNGEFVKEGTALVTISSHKSSLLEVDVNPKYYSLLASIQNIWYQTALGTWSSLNEAGGKILSKGREVSKTKPLLSLYAKVNEAIEMPEGSFTEIQMALGNPENSLVIPESALLESYGKYAVIVQLSGEKFERRAVKIGRKNGTEVEIIQGLMEGEVVVTTGAYQVKMASMSGQVPAHGHAH